MRKILTVAVAFCLLFSLFCGVLTLSAEQLGIVSISSGTLNVRAGAGTGFAVIGSLQKNDTVTVRGSQKNGNDLWYEIEKGALRGFASAAYITLQTAYSPDADFESYLDAQGFPESYRAGLRALHAAYPNWVFAARHIVPSFGDALNAEARVGKNLVASYARTSWKSMDEGAYNWDTKQYVAFDSGGWVTAQREVVAYYMDPRNFLDDTGIFQFESLSFSASHTLDGVRQIFSGTFMSGMEEMFMQAAREAGVSVLHLASRARQEQGANGNALGRGYVLDGVTYYNFFNIGAYPANDKSAVENGAAYARARGWDTPQKAIAGGAAQIGRGYINMEQNTLYLQKFDVVDGGNGYYNHQYMSNVTAAKSESNSMKRAYAECAGALQGALIFHIPVYTGMPDTACAAPQSQNGNNDNTLVGLSVAGYSLTPTFYRYTTDYTLSVPEGVTAVTVAADKSDGGASVSGAGVIPLAGGETTVSVQVTAPSGLVRTYTLHIYGGSSAGGGVPSVGSSVYTVADCITGIAPGITADTLLAGLTAQNGTVRLVTANGAAVTGNVATGQVLQLLSGDTVHAAFPIVIYGDVNGDGAVTSRDLLRTQKHILGISALSGSYFTAADSNKDGNLTSRDLLRTQKQILGITSPIL